jgi:hypothetical protein
VLARRVAGVTVQAAANPVAIGAPQGEHGAAAVLDVPNGRLDHPVVVEGSHSLLLTSTDE